MVRAVSFDFWDTLFHSLGRDGGPSHAEIRAGVLRDFLKARGDEFTLEQTRAAHDKAEERLFEHWRTDLRHSGAEQAMADIADCLGVEFSGPETSELAERMRMTSQIPRIVPLEGVAGMLAELSGRYRLGIVSDTWLSPGELLRDIMRGFGLLGLFTATVFSDETGYLKPHENQFRLLAAGLGVNPDEIVHVGDSERRDVRGAHGFGMRAVLLAVEGRPDPSEADVVIGHLAELPRAIARLGARSGPDVLSP